MSLCRLQASLPLRRAGRACQARLSWQPAGRGSAWCLCLRLSPRHSRLSRWSQAIRSKKKVRAVLELLWLLTCLLFLLSFCWLFYFLLRLLPCLLLCQIASTEPLFVRFPGPAQLCAWRGASFQSCVLNEALFLQRSPLNERQALFFSYSAVLAGGRGMAGTVRSVLYMLAVAGGR